MILSSDVNSPIDNTTESSYHGGKSPNLQSNTRTWLQLLQDRDSLHALSMSGNGIPFNDCDNKHPGVNCLQTLKPLLVWKDVRQVFRIVFGEHVCTLITLLSIAWPLAEVCLECFILVVQMIAEWLFVRLLPQLDHRQAAKPMWRQEQWPKWGQSPWTETRGDVTNSAGQWDSLGESSSSWKGKQGPLSWWSFSWVLEDFKALLAHHAHNNHPVTLSEACWLFHSSQFPMDSEVILLLLMPHCDLDGFQQEKSFGLVLIIRGEVSWSLVWSAFVGCSDRGSIAPTGDDHSS